MQDDDDYTPEPKPLTREERQAAMKELAKEKAREFRKKAYAKAKVRMQEQRVIAKQKKADLKAAERAEKRGALSKFIRKGRDLDAPEAADATEVAPTESLDAKKPPSGRAVGHLTLVHSQEA